MTGKCFYCSRLVHLPAGGVAVSAGPLATVDHIFPRALLRQFVGPLPEWWRRANKVPCCHGCNTRKADKHPALWLATLSPGPGRDRLTSRLHKLGTLCQHRGAAAHGGRHQPRSEASGPAQPML